MIEQVDSSVGKVLDALDRLKLADNTIIVFMSDNGPACNEGIFTDNDRKRRNINNYLGHKGNMWERGIQSPLFIRWPQTIQPHRVSRLCDICDIMPTLLDCCDIKPPDIHLDGRSIKDYLQGDESKLEAKESFIWVSPGWPPDPERGYSIMGVQREYHPIAPEKKSTLPAAEQLASIRTEEWKLLRNPGAVPNQPDLYNNQALFHLTEDPKERCNLAESEGQKRSSLSSRITEWFEDIRQEPHAFCMPEFTIGDNKRTSFIAAYGPVHCTGNLSNAGNGLFNWCSIGDSADYQVTVTDSKTYEVAIHFTRSLNRDAASIELQLQSDNHVIRKEITGDGECILGNILLDAGPQTLTLSVSNTTDASDKNKKIPQRAILEKIVMLKFTASS